ncbi:MAG: hypothetical protein HYW01_12605 [Deltaproteobacteria bacterium]|nr:hypothetical protein [Deltaproteobacteria bacterium]
MVNFVIGLIVFIIVFLAIYFKQGNQPKPVPAREAAKKEDPKSPKVEDSVKPEEPIDPFKSAVPPKE